MLGKSWWKCLASGIKSFRRSGLEYETEDEMRLSIMYQMWTRNNRNMWPLDGSDDLCLLMDRSAQQFSKVKMRKMPSLVRNPDNSDWRVEHNYLTWGLFGLKFGVITGVSLANARLITIENSVVQEGPLATYHLKPILAPLPAYCVTLNATNAAWCHPAMLTSAALKKKVNAEVMQKPSSGGCVVMQSTLELNEVVMGILVHCCRRRVVIQWCSFAMYYCNMYRYVI